MRRGEIHFAPFLYADLGQSKRRPVCIVSGTEFNSGPDLVVAMVTSRRSRLETPGVGDVALVDWKAAGLLAPSTVRAGRLQTIEATLLTRRLGAISLIDSASLDSALRRVLDL